MKYVELGKTGERVSAMCLGTMMFGDRCDQVEADGIVGTALDQGVTFIDTAAMYCGGLTETILGHILKGRREQVFLATKVHKGIDRQSIVESIDESLTRLQVEYIDLYLIHWPVEGMRPAEVMEALNQVVVDGKARYVGCCNYPAWLLAHSNALAERDHWPIMICNQVPYNLVERGIEVEILPQAVAEGIAITVYRPLLIGLLAGKYQSGDPLPADSRGQKDPRIADWLVRYGESIEAFRDYADRLNLYPSQLAVAWLQATPGITASIVGVSSLAQLEPAIRAFDVTLTAEQHQEVSALFDTQVKEEAGGKFPALRRSTSLTS